MRRLKFRQVRDSPHQKEDIYQVPPGHSHPLRRGGPAGRTHPPASCASGLWLRFLGASRHAVSVAVAVRRSFSWLHSAPSHGHSAAHTACRPRAFHALPFGHRPAFQLCVSSAAEVLALVTFNSDDAPSLDYSRPATQREIRALVLSI